MGVGDLYSKYIKIMHVKLGVVWIEPQRVRVYSFGNGGGDFHTNDCFCWKICSHLCDAGAHVQQAVNVVGNSRQLRAVIKTPYDIPLY